MTACSGRPGDSGAAEGHSAAPVLAGIDADYPGWHAWRGVSGLWYARRPRSSPPVTLRARRLAVLRMKVAVKDAEIRARAAR
jgi:hypothetical protein